MSEQIKSRLLAVLVVLGIVGYTVYEHHQDKVYERQQIEREEQREAEEEQYRIRNLKEAGPDEVSPADYKEWRLYNPFEIEYMLDYMDEVDSSSIYLADYEEAWEALGICFRNHPDDIYVYFGVDSKTARDFLHADSVGEYYDDHIKGQYKSQKYIYSKAANGYIQDNFTEKIEGGKSAKGR